MYPRKIWEICIEGCVAERCEGRKYIHICYYCDRVQDHGYLDFGDKPILIRVSKNCAK